MKTKGQKKANGNAAILAVLPVELKKLASLPIGDWVAIEKLCRELPEEARALVRTMKRLAA